MKLFYTLIFLFSSYFLLAQNLLEINNIKPRLDAHGLLFLNLNTFDGGFEAPADSGLHSFYSFDFWVGGVFDTVAYAHGSRFLQLSDSDLRFGPMMDAEYYETEDEIWDRVWNITKADIDYHIINFNQAGYIIPEVIENWPAHGDPDKGQASDLAPFVDVNNNGIYQPLMGDYPFILGDQAIYAMYNGDRSNDGKPTMGIETHVMLYAYSSDELLDETVFAYVKHYNRSGNTYINSYLGTFSDFDLGNASDDIAFTDVTRSSVYARNGDAFDENGYGSILPYQSTTILRGVKQDNDGLDNVSGIEPYQSVNGLGYGDDIIDNEYRGLDFSIKTSNGSSITGDPISSNEYYNSMSGRWNDGTYVVYGGNGYPSGTPSVISRYTQSENDPLLFGTYGIEPENEWDLQMPQDVRFIGSSGPFIFTSGECRDMYVAFVFKRPNSGSETTDLMMFKEDIDYALDNFETIGGSQCSDIVSAIDENKKLKTNTFSLYPNPTEGTISYHYKGNDKDARLFIYDARGKLLETMNVNFSLNQLDIAQFDGNIFFLKIVDNTGSFTQKLVKH